MHYLTITLPTESNPLNEMIHSSPLVAGTMISRPFSVLRQGSFNIQEVGGEFQNAKGNTSNVIGRPTVNYFDTKVGNLPCAQNLYKFKYFHLLFSLKRNRFSVLEKIFHDHVRCFHSCEIGH